MSKEFENLLGQYWDLAYLEGKSGVFQGDKANEVLHALKNLAEQPAFVQIGNRPKEEDYTKLTSYIEALEIYVDRKELQWKAFEDYDCDAIDAMLAEKKELAQQPAQPRTVAYHFSRRDSFGRVVWDVGHAVHPDATEWHPLVRQSPAQRKPLTVEEIGNLLPDDDTPMSLGEAFVKFARAIEAAHGIKGNT